MGEAKRRALYRANLAALARIDREAEEALYQKRLAASRKGVATRAANKEAAAKRSEAAKRAAQTRRLNRETALDNAGWNPRL
jgi:hypothetical protein